MLGCCITTVQAIRTTTVSTTRRMLSRLGLTRCATPSGLIDTPSIDVSTDPVASSTTPPTAASTYSPGSSSSAQVNGLPWNGIIASAGSTAR